MSPLVKELLINGLMAGTAVHKAKKTSTSIAYYGAAGGIGCLALVFFSIAGYNALQVYFDAPMAAAMTGLALVVLGGIVSMVGYHRINGKKIAPKMSNGGFIDTVEDTIKSLLDGFEEPIKDNPKMALLMAALAGFAAGDKLGEKTH